MPVQLDVKDRLLKGATVDYILGSSASRKYALMKRLIDPFPQPIRIGRSCRWLESQVQAWVVRQVEGSSQPTPESVTPVMPADLPEAPIAVRKQIDVQHAKQLYESGATLDQLCAQLRTGKGRLSKALRDAGTQMRAPGRSKQAPAHLAQQPRPAWPTEFAQPQRVDSANSHEVHP